MVLNKMKKIILLTLIISTTLVFAGCTNTNTGDGNTGGTDTSTTTEGQGPDTPDPDPEEEIDKSELERVISEARNLHNSAEEGYALNQYELGAKAELMSAIDESEMIYNDDSVQQSEINEAVSNLSWNIANFNEKIITSNDRDEYGNYTREYVENYLRNDMPDYEGMEINVLDANFDVDYNGELCYEVSLFAPTAGGFGQGIQFYIGANTLNEYSYDEVEGW